MGKTRDTGFLTDCVFTDSSNNVGIGGAANASYKLAVTGNTLGTGTAFDFFTSSGIGSSGVTGLLRVVTAGTSTGIAIGQANSSRYTAIQPNEHIIYNDDFFMRTNGAFPLSLGTNNTIRMTITSAGNVGIGTSSPTQILDVFGPRVRMGDGGGFELNFNTTTFAAFQLNGTERMRIGSQGNVGIGQVNATDVRLFVRSAGSGSATYNIYSRDVNAVDLFAIRDDGYGYLKAAAWAYGSDRRIKENINYIESGLDKILALKPAIFDYIDGVKNNIGWIAQDVQEVIPEAVNTISEDNDQLTLKSDFIIPYLVKAIQELSAKVTALENQS